MLCVEDRLVDPRLDTLRLVLIRTVFDVAIFVLLEPMVVRDSSDDEGKDSSEEEREDDAPPSVETDELCCVVTLDVGADEVDDVRISEEEMPEAGDVVLDDRIDETEDGTVLDDRTVEELGAWLVESRDVVDDEENILITPTRPVTNTPPICTPGAFFI